MAGLGTPELLIIAFVVVLLFGSKKLPDAARSIGRSMRIFKAETKGLREDDPAAPAPAAPPAIEPARPAANPSGSPAARREQS
jgi:sec-independent protein translocase protein TatA